MQNVFTTYKNTIISFAKTNVAITWKVASFFAAKGPKFIKVEKFE